MRNASSVTYPVGRCVLYGRILLSLGAAAVLIWTTLGAYFMAAPPWLAGGGALLCGVWGLLAWRTWQRAPQGELRWDGLAASLHPGAPSGCWWWRAQTSPHTAQLVQVEWVLDAQNSVLLRLRADRQARFWVWLEAAQAPARWDDLRRALVAHT